MELFNTSTPDKAFKTSVRPLGVLLILQSLILLYIISTWPAETLARFPLPFIPDSAKQYFLITFAILILVIGIGLYMRSRLLWYWFISYLIIGPCWPIAGVAFDYFPGIGLTKKILIPVLVLVAAIISGGLYIVTKPAFKESS